MKKINEDDSRGRRPPDMLTRFSVFSLPSPPPNKTLSHQNSEFIYQNARRHCAVYQHKCNGRTIFSILPFLAVRFDALPRVQDSFAYARAYIVIFLQLLLISVLITL